MNDKSPNDSLSRRLRWLMLFRVATTTFLLITTVVVDLRSVGLATETALRALYVLIGSIYFLTLLYAVVLPRIAGEKFQAYVQVFGDILFITGVIFLTGGLESAFSFMYMLTIINAGVLLKTRGAVIAASLSAILYGGLLDLHYYRYINPYLTKFSYVDYYRATDILNTILINMGAFYLVAVLSGYLSKQAEESRQQLRDQETHIVRLEELNDSIIQNIDSGLITLGHHGEILTFNPAAERITGLTFDKVAGVHYTDVLAGLEFRGDGGAGRSRTWNWSYVSPDGRELFLDVDLVDLPDTAEGRQRRLLVLQDRTRIRLMEDEVERVERLAAIGEMAAGIAHEIRNPLASMSGSFQMLQADPSDHGDRQRLLKIIRREMDRLNHIVTDFLLFARPRSGAPRPIDLGQTIQDILGIFESQSELKGSIEIKRDFTPMVHALFDPDQLEQIIWNLLRNAVEAMPDGGVLFATVDRPETQPGMVRFIVSDTGGGMTEDELPRIFDPFFTTKEKGSGLGLAIVHRITESGGGRVEVDTRLGVGTAFTVYLPEAPPFVPNPDSAPALN